ncbi:Aste57867_7580 [Aphanomyces stellatus]|uniref:Aste57867_1612 protein n=1 Tax=Aphanomyces stellatus TaxID=120398 RepID=A0A485KIL7_9STRA|nr:hypothetical protein As57867_007553 [Aphanomyces stellatus]KAF0718566.1 hypothetical protein As57867_001610 [Aphanomyces stellatus]VFT78825.1 Aste57867_1612 [Aphanomyces stellatus]VFT84488.1 Aste57867_7580 [Aphanomyces stellatus]
MEWSPVGNLALPSGMAFAVSAICVLLSVLVILFWRQSYQLRCIPGPNPLHSVLGQSLDAFAGVATWSTTGTFPEPFLTYTMRYGGAYRMRELWYNVVHIADPVAIQHILLANAANYPRDGMVQHFLNDTLLGVGLLGMNGVQHSKTRKMLNPHFTTSQIKALLPIVNAQLQKTVARLAASVGDVDMGHVLKELTLGVIGLAAFGMDFETYSQAHTAYKAYQDPPSAFTLVGMVTVPGFLRLPLPELVRRRAMQAALKTTITDVIESKLAPSEDRRRPLDLLDGMLPHLTTKEAVAHTMTFLFAGHETSSSALAWVLATLTEHPQWAVSIQQEYRHVVAKHGSLAKWEAMQELATTLAVIQETMRLRPVVYTLIPRRPLRDDHVLLSDGTSMFIPQNTKLEFNVASIHRNPRYWTRPSAFLPERFLDDTAEYKADLALRGGRSHAFVYMPFSAGAASCIGYRFALAEMQMIVATLVSSFEFDLTTKADLGPAFNGVTLSPTKLNMSVRAVGAPKA